MGKELRVSCLLGKQSDNRAREVAHGLRVLVAVAENQSLIPSTHLVAQNHISPHSREFHRHAHGTHARIQTTGMHMVHMYSDKIFMHVK